MSLTIDDLILCHCCIYVALGIYEPSEELNDLLYEDANTTIQILGMNSFSEKIENFLPLPNQDNGNQNNENIQLKRNGLLLNAKNHAILYIESRMPMSDVMSHKKECSELPAYAQTPLKNQSDLAFQLVSSSLTIARGSRLSKDFQQIYCKYHVEDNNTKIHFVWDTPNLSSSIGPMTKLSSDELITTKELIKLFTTKNELIQIINLYSNSLTPYIHGHLFSFIAAWTALEMFIVKQFKDFRPEITTIIKGIPELEKLYERIIMKDNEKFSLQEKLTAIIAYYHNDLNKSLVHEFNEIKKVRDKFIHNMKGDVRSLPLDSTKQFFLKCIHLYLQKHNKDFTIQKDG
ncbi:hypothetical protein ACJBLD_17005 [Acinetobacter nosocomialis]|uniref:hypothetical protein n=1 Tax=Acinetobacter nosocomialis TaxID=106654 RepID=UPI0025A095B1|nr:hypothetical protein [Acinetobacter nosocomialis]